MPRWGSSGGGWELCCQVFSVASLLSCEGTVSDAAEFDVLRVALPLCWGQAGSQRIQAGEQFA